MKQIATATHTADKQMRMKKIDSNQFLMHFAICQKVTEIVIHGDEAAAAAADVE